MKRYALLGRITGDGVIPIQAVEHDEGNFVHYEDVKELLDWMRGKREEWKNNNIKSVINNSYWGSNRWAYLEGCEYCGEELEQKLREIGEL